MKECLSEPLCFHLRMPLQYIYGLPETKEEPESETGRKYKYAGKEGLMLPWHLPFLQPMASYSIQQIIGGMNTQRLSDVLAQTRLNLDPDENIIFIYHGAPAHHSPADPGKIRNSRNCPHIIRSSTLQNKEFHCQGVPH